ncbi:hypothetical protein L3N51_01764 [Metallosphaera sp. J1]|nr:hypothetical protein [Metallosphaera javensis (ex Hofmann et al. 2022)]
MMRSPYLKNWRIDTGEGQGNHVLNSIVSRGSMVVRGDVELPWSFLRDEVLIDSISICPGIHIVTPELNPKVYLYKFYVVCIKRATKKQEPRLS